MFKINKFDKYFEKGQNHIKKGEYTKAKEAYLQCLALQPDEIGVLNNLAQITSLLGEYGQSQGYNEILLKECNKRLKYEKTERLLILKTNALVSLKKNDEANKIIDELLKLNPNNIIGLFHKAQYFELNKQYDKSLEYIEKILKKNPDNITALLSKGRILMELNDFEKSEKCFNKVLKFETKNKSAINLKSQLLKKKYNVTLTPHDLMLKAIEHWDMKKFKSSQDYFKKALEMDSKYDEIWFAQGELFIRLGKISEAINSFNKAFDLNPESGGILNKKSFYKTLNRMLKINKILGYEK